MYVPNNLSTGLYRSFYNDSDGETRLSPNHIKQLTASSSCYSVKLANAVVEHASPLFAAARFSFHERATGD